MPDNPERCLRHTVYPEGWENCRLCESYAVVPDDPHVRRGYYLTKKLPADFEATEYEKLDRENKKPLLLTTVILEINRITMQKNTTETTQNQQKSHNHAGNGLSAKLVQEAANELRNPQPGEHKVLEHSEILDAILDMLSEIDFKKIANLKTSDTLPQKHLLVLCINELLTKVKEANFDLARKDDFIFAFNGAYWKELDREILKNFLGKAAQKQNVGILDAQHYKFKNELYNQFLSSAHFEPIKQQKNVVLINLQNGTFEISKKSQTLRSHSSRDFLTYQLPFKYDEAATCPMFQRFLDKVLPEKELQDIVAEYFGYVFTKGLKMEKAMLLYGSGANGKSVLFDIVNALLGKENISNFSLSNLLEEHNRALIAYKLLNYGSEINATKTRDEFKNLVSTEPIQARLKYGNSFTMEDYAKLAFNCNELPTDFDHKEAYFRRLLIIPFRVTIPEDEQDKTLAGKIINTELAGVFNWIIAGLKRLLKTEKFTESQVVKNTLETYRRESDSVASFLHEEGYISSLDTQILLASLFIEYVDFCKRDGYFPLKKVKFGKRLDALNIKTRNGTGNKVFACVEKKA